LQAENVRGDLVLEMYERISWRIILKNVFDRGRRPLEALAEFLWDINWVFGGRFDLSCLDRYKEFNKRVDDMRFWNTGQKSIEVNEMLDTVDKKRGWPINVEFRV
jgi:hypothetical protein